ncbi:MAG TPA: response regulator [Anaerolineales bacterium]|nr:response regulator [Anaerolineales bacterium]
MAVNRILIIDDEVNNRKTLAAILAPLGAEIFQAVNGRAGLELALEVKPDIVLLDVMMPDLDGYEVCRRVRDEPTLAEVPIIMITALDDRDSRLAGIEAGADDFIAKPVDRVELRARVQTLLRLNRYRRLMGERARLSWMADHSNDAYVLLDAKGEILYANPRAALWFGQAEGDELGGDFAALADARYQRALQSDGRMLLVRPETELQRALWLEWKEFEAPVESAGSRFIHLRDVSDLIELQRGAWSFNTLVTHKLRTPLAGLATGLELLTDMARESGIKDLAEMGDLTRRSLAGLQGAIEEVLTFVNAPRLTSGGQPFALASLAELVAAQALEIGVEAKVSIAPDIRHLSLKLTEPAIRLVLSELLANAQKFHPTHSPIIQVQAQGGAPGRVLLQVADDGRGLPPEELAIIWRPYYQGEKSLTGQMAGMGLGLTLVGGLVLSAGGRVKARNREAATGLCIELDLPVCTTCQTGSAAEPMNPLILATDGTTSPTSPSP